MPSGDNGSVLYSILRALSSPEVDRETVRVLGRKLSEIAESDGELAPIEYLGQGGERGEGRDFRVRFRKGRIKGGGPVELKVDRRKAGKAARRQSGEPSGE